MRVVVTGASGNIGTAVLERLDAAGHAVDGLCRRPPDPAPPYASASWHAVDLTTDQAGPILRELCSGADAVVHLAWAIQPNRDREYLRRVNVDGSDTVFGSAVAAGVPHLVHLSSIGAYSPSAGNTPRSESWPTDGVRGSGYSQDKAAVERALDRLALAHPEVVVTRLRPGLVLQRRAAAEIERYFAGPLVPRALWRAACRGNLPVVPLPGRLTVQFVHAQDVAAAVETALRRRPSGAINLAAEPVLDASELARIIGRRRVPLPSRVLHGLVALSWRARLQPTDPGWVDLAMAAPVMDTRRARTELDWTPTWTATEAVQDLLAGLADAIGIQASPTMRPPGSSGTR